MLTLPPKRRGREQAACWQLLRFAAGLTRPDGTSARVSKQPGPVETTHPHRTEPSFGARILAPASIRANRELGCQLVARPAFQLGRDPVVWGAVRSIQGRFAHPWTAGRSR